MREFHSRKQPTPEGQDKPPASGWKYAACKVCTAKWFSPMPISQCPRCGSDSQNVVKAAPPWHSQPPEPSAEYVVRAWSKLPPNIREAIVTLVDAVRSDHAAKNPLRTESDA